MNTEMTQTLLADRLKLVVHREQREMKYLALVAGKGGTKMAAADESQECNTPSIFAAVQEQLGLRLESRKAPLDVLVVDQAQKIPAEN
jgi:hypothetical protein